MHARAARGQVVEQQHARPALRDGCRVGARQRGCELHEARREDRARQLQQRRLGGDHRRGGGAARGEQALELVALCLERGARHDITAAAAAGTIAAAAAAEQVRDRAGRVLFGQPPSAQARD